jgi:hypothetical protein
MSKGREGIRWSRVVVVVLALVVINVPYAVFQWQQHRVATDGDEVVASVVSVHKAGDDIDVAFRLPRSVDEGQKARVVRVHRDVGLAAARTQQLEVRVLHGNPDVYHVEGQVNGWGGLILTLVADALVLLMVLLFWRFGGRIRRPTLVGVAVEDVQDGEEGSLLDKQ